MRDQMFWRKTGRIADLLTERLDVDAERALDLLYNSHTYALLANPESDLCLQSDAYILTDILRELESGDCSASPAKKPVNNPYPSS